MSDIFVAEKNGKCHAIKGVPFLFGSLGACKSFIRQQDMLVGFRPRIATDEERKGGRFLEIHDSDGTSVPPSVSIGEGAGLVALHENFKERRFAISSRAATEAEFVFEVSNALASLPDVEPSLLEVRYREFIPLFVDMCCKYRGYKADRVHESILLVAGDLDMPVDRSKL